MFPILFINLLTMLMCGTTLVYDTYFAIEEIGLFEKHSNCKRSLRGSKVIDGQTRQVILNTFSNISMKTKFTANKRVKNCHSERIE